MPLTQGLNYRSACDIYGGQLCNGFAPETVEARPNRKAENGSGVIGKGAASQRVPPMRSRSSPSKVPEWGPGGAPEN